MERPRTWDNLENAEVVWALRRDVAKFIEQGSIYAPALMILEGAA
jgi:hypothetical protein